MNIRITRRITAVLAIGAATLAPAAFVIPAHFVNAGSSDVAEGSQGDTVRQVQQALVRNGLLTESDVDGVFGPNTAAAVAKFQRSNGLHDTGKVDEVTKIALGIVKSSIHGLKQGSKGEAVERLQRELIAAGYSPGAVDGVFGVSTAYAVKKFQGSLGYLQTGEVNAATAAALEDVSVASTSEASGANAAAGSVTNIADMRMSIGSSGASVRKAQQILIDLKYDVVGGADGIYGAMTANAMRAFQRDNGLYVDGIVGKYTAAMLAKASRGKVPSAPSTPSSGYLRTGMTGSAVKALQQRLLEVGVPVTGGADGIFGPATARAVRLFQGWYGLAQDGVVGPKTREALKNAKRKDPSDSQPSGDIGYAVYGERGSRVEALQQKLVNAGINLRGGVDGVFGKGTASAVMSFQRANGLTVTGVVSEATAKKLGLSTAERPSQTQPKTPNGGGYIKAFPVQGWCGYSNTWGDPRSGGRRHEGTDIIAAEGKLLYAINDGVIEKIYSEASDRLAGNGVRLRLADGTYAFYAHMAGLGPGIKVGTRVSAGQVVGTVGTTGNAYTPHLHFEIHPRGGSAVNPYPYLKAVDACQVTTPR